MTARLLLAFGLCLTLALLAGCAGPPYLPARSAPPPPTAPLTVEHGSEFFPASDGTQLYAQWWRPRVPEHPRGYVVLVHGLKDHSSRYADLAVKLVERGLAVYAMDLRGHAHSAGVRVGVGDFEDYLRDLDRLVARASAREPGEPMFLFGHSMGGAIATLWTIERKPALSGLVLSGAALEANVSGAKIFGTRVIAALLPSAEVFQLDLADFSRDKQVVRECAADLLVYQDPAPARTARELLDAIGTIQDRMGEVRVPLLAMHGSADVVTPPEGSRQLVARAASTDKTLRIWPGLMHDLVHEPEKEQVMKEVVAWIDARAPKAAVAEVGR